MFLTDAKDSGSVENSSSLIIGAWRDPEESGIIHLKVLKNTRGVNGHHARCRFNGDTMTITEDSAKIDSQDVPKPYAD